MNKSFSYLVDGKSFVVEITYKRIKNIHYKFRNGVFQVSCPFYTTQKSIIIGLDKYAEKLIKLENKTPPFTDDYVYIFGFKVPIKNINEINFDNGLKIAFKNKENLEKKLRTLLLETITSRVRFYEKQLGLEPYFVKVRNMTTRYGVNNKYKKTLTFATMLIHYSYEIIDSIILHELCHEFYYNHSKSFYDVLYRYCPKYDICRKKLRKGIFS